MVISSRSRCSFLFTHLCTLHQYTWVSLILDSSSAFPATSLGFVIFGEIFAYMTVFQSNHRGNHIPSLWMVHAGCVIVSHTHLSRVFWVHAMECMCAQTRPQTLIQTLHHAGQRAKHTTDWAIPAPDYCSKVINLLHLPYRTNLLVLCNQNFQLLSFIRTISLEWLFQVNKFILHWHWLQYKNSTKKFISDYIITSHPNLHDCQLLKINVFEVHAKQKDSKTLTAFLHTLWQDNNNKIHVYICLYI